jgi:hypothetical protein
MVQALLNTKPDTWPAEAVDSGKPYKWMTRRVIKPQPKYPLREKNGRWHAYSEKPMADRICNSPWGYQYSCPYQVGDILWVRETFTKTDDGDYIYRSDPVFDGMGKGDFSWPWTSPLFLPRKAARLFLEVKAVRAERLQEITEKAVRAEGLPESVIFDHIVTRFIGPYCDAASSCTKENKVCSPDFCHDQNCFAAFWNTLNAKRGYSWEINPWVWVYEFMRAEREG